MKTHLSDDAKHSVTAIWNHLRNRGRIQLSQAHFEVSIMIPFNHGIQISVIIVDVRDYSQTAVLIGIDLFISEHNGVIWIEKSTVHEADLDNILKEVHLTLSN